ncbi:hypothetical protein PhCBS80983_g06473 [Powellomyces hirtus]|uniref:Uncharacterized protein n=1 Tax=Powellomyces hirtus TaxID=109895 RepID=A0A507DM98_9FUNG|nr:hypothetical protein PhCBS80983_g06473 [Powellomyces hirtus]
MLNGGAVAWKGQRQKSVSLSTAEAEYIALTECAKESTWLNGLFRELTGLPSTTIIIHEDNQAAMKLANNPVLHQRTKHIDVRHHFIRDYVQEGRIQLSYIDTTQMIADIHTKPLPRPTFETLRSLMGLQHPH